jgi:hypothetical protein
LKRLVIVLAAALAAVAIYAVTAPAGQQTSSSQLISLSKRVTALEKKTKLLTQRLNCLNTYAPLTAYGDSQNGTEGYLYKPQNTTTPAVTTAVDFTAQNDTADANVAVVKASCIGSAKLSFSKVAALEPSSH